MNRSSSDDRALCRLCHGPAAAFVDERPFCRGCLLRLLSDPISSGLVGRVRPVGEPEPTKTRRRIPLSGLAR